MKKNVFKRIANFISFNNFKHNFIIFLIIFSFIYILWGNAASEESNESIQKINSSLNASPFLIETFDFGTLHIIDGNDNPLFCTLTLFDENGIVKVSDFTDALSIEKINPDSHINIDSDDNIISLDFSIDGDSFDPLVRIADYGTSNPVGDYKPPGSPVRYVSIDADNLSYSNLRLTISYSDTGMNIDAGKLKIFKYVQTSAYNEWIEIPSQTDEKNKAVWIDINSTSIFSVSIVDDTATSENITVGTISVLDSSGIFRPAEISIIGPLGKLAGSNETLTIDEVPRGSRLVIHSSEKNAKLDFILDADSLDPVILLEDFGSENPAGDYLPPGEPVKYLLMGAENLGYSHVNLTVYYPDITQDFTLSRQSETFAYNEWEELPAVVDSTSNSITASLNSLSFFALCKKSASDVEVMDIKDAPLTVNLKTYDRNKKPHITKCGHTFSINDIPPLGYMEVDALAEKGVGITFKSANSTGGKIVLDNHGKYNPEAVYPNRIPVRFVEIHAGNINFDSADIEIYYSDDEIGDMDENKLQISHFSGGAWVNLDSVLDPVNNIVKATTGSLSTFALIYNGTSVNARKSIYQPGETAQIVIVVLDSMGTPVSDGNIRMNVTAPDGSIEYYSTLPGSIIETHDPGVYEAVYLTSAEGRYNISCTAIIEGGESSFDTSFIVKSEYDFDIIRYAQSKIDPTRDNTFDVAIEITSYTDADAITIWEYVPADFEVNTDAGLVEADNLKVLTWQRSIVNNRTSVSYSYSVPMEWPKLYLLGPAEIDYGNKTFTEARSWYVAVDPELMHTYDFSSGAGVNRSAYGYQVVSPKPPNSNDLPDIQFTSAEYSNITANDNNFQSDYAESLNYYATHRFKFEIEENVETFTEILIFWNGMGYNDGSNLPDGSTLYIWNYHDDYYQQLDINYSDNEINLTGQITANFDSYLDDDGNVTVLVQQNGYSTQSKGGAWRHSHLETDYINLNIANNSAGNHPPSLEKLKTYNSSLIGINIFEIGENVTIRVNVTDPEGSDDIDKVLIKLIHPDSTVMVNNITMTNISGITSGYVYEYNYTVPDELASTGYWIIHIYANDTSDAQATVQTVFKVITLNGTVHTDGPYNPGDTVRITGRILYYNGMPVDQAAVELNSTDPDNIAINCTTVYTNTGGYYSLNYTLNDNATVGMYTVKANITKENLQQIEYATYSVKEVPVPSNIRIVTDRDVYLITPQIWADNDVTYFSPRVVNITALVMDDDGLPLQGKNLNVNIRYPNNSVRSVTMNESDGYWNGSFTVYHDDPEGTYFINANITNGVSYSENSTFDVDRFKCDSVECHDYGFHNLPTTRGAHNASAQEAHLVHSPVSARGVPTSVCTLCHTGQNLACDECHTDLFRGTHANVSGNTLAEKCNYCHSGYNDSADTGIDKSVPECNSSGCHLGEHEDKPEYLHRNTHAGNNVLCGYCHNNMHSIFEPNCNLCHQTQNNHSSYNTTGVNCVQCHNNAILNYTGTKMYSGIYNTETTVHSANTTPAGSGTLLPLCTTCHSKTADEIEAGYDSYAMNNDSNNLAPNGSNMTHRRDTITGDIWGTDPPDYNVRYARHANPNSSGGWPNATGSAREPNQICINCHSERIRYWGDVNEDTWDAQFDQHCDPCHYLWVNETVLPDAHTLSIPYCSDCHGQLTDANATPGEINFMHSFSFYFGCGYCHIPNIGTQSSPDHRQKNLMDPPKDYGLTPSIGMMLNDSVHKRMTLNTTTNHPTNYTGCLVCHTGVNFTINTTSDPINITITDHSGGHTWTSKPDCTKCHSIDTSVERPGPIPNAHESLNLDWGNNTQCLKCHNIYNQTVRYTIIQVDDLSKPEPFDVAGTTATVHGHDATTEGCTSCHFNYTAMNNYGKPMVYVNETMYSSSVHGTAPGTNCTRCHTQYHPPPEYSWKWCECCHSYQSDPLNEIDRHNVTADPLNYSINVNGTPTQVLDITDCTTCHKATTYNTAKSTFNRSSSKDCRYCHTFPD